MVGSVSLTDQKSLLSELESAFKRDVLERDKFPLNTRNVEINISCQIWKALFITPQFSFLLRGIFNQTKTIKLIQVICFVGSKQIGVLLTDNWVGTTPIANGHDKTLHIGMCKCLASLPSPHAVQTRARCVCSPE